MVLKNVLIGCFCATALVGSGPAVADGYAPDEFLGLDLSAAVLSPKPLGPAASFTLGPLDVAVDPNSNRVQVIAEPKVEPKRIAPKVVAQRTRVTHAARTRAEPRLMARTKIVRHHRNPLDAQALDTRIQVWPCKSGGICNWKR